MSHPIGHVWRQTQGNLVPSQNPIRQLLCVAHLLPFRIICSQVPWPSYSLHERIPFHPRPDTHDLKLRHCLSRLGLAERGVRDLAKLSGFGRQVASGAAPWSTTSIRNKRCRLFIGIVWFVPLFQMPSTAMSHSHPRLPICNVRRRSGVSLRGLAGRIKAEEHPHCRAEREGDNDRVRGDQRRPFVDRGDQLGAAVST